VVLTTETNRMHVVLFGMQNRTFNPCLADINRILILAMPGDATAFALVQVGDIALETDVREQHRVEEGFPCTAGAIDED
jgi:hypothetical protein